MLRLAITLDTTDQAADLVAVLLAAADRATRRQPEQAALWRDLANGIGDGLDALDEEPATETTRRPPILRPRDDQIDELAVERVVRGMQPYPLLTEQEAQDAAAQLTERGESAAEIARRTGVEPRTVHRWRAATRTSA